MSDLVRILLGIATFFAGVGIGFLLHMRFGK